MSEMQSTTKWSIGLISAWFLLKLIAGAAAPDRLPGFDNREQANFVSAINTANFFQSIGSICLIAAIICICITVYRNVMDKTVNKNVFGPNVEHSPGSNVATGGSVVATGRAVVAAYGGNLIINKGDEINKNLDNIDSYIKQSEMAEDEKRKARLIINYLRKDAEKPSEDKEDTAYHIKDLAKMFQGAGEISSAIKSSIENLIRIFGVNV